MSRFVIYMSGNNSVVECNLAKVEVASSNLVSRSTYIVQKVRQWSNLFLLFVPSLEETRRT